MNSPFVLVWTVLTFASIFWYGYLVFYIGIRAGREILELMKTLARRE